MIVYKGKKYNQNAGKSISDRKFGYVHGIKKFDNRKPV